MMRRDRQAQCGPVFIAEMKASSRSGPLTFRNSASASSAGATGAVGWITVTQMRIAESWTLAPAAVEEGRTQRIDALGASDHRCLFAAGKFRKRAQRDLAGPLRQPASATAKKFIRERLA